MPAMVSQRFAAPLSVLVVQPAGQRRRRHAVEVLAGRRPRADLEAVGEGARRRAGFLRLQRGGQRGAAGGGDRERIRGGTRSSPGAIAP